MESLPPQPIHSLVGQTRIDSYTKVIRICILLLEGKDIEDIANNPDIDFGSPDAMRQQLKQWGLAGLLPPEAGEQPKEKERVNKPQAEPMAQPDKGKAKELPAAANAQPLFRVAIQRLVSDCEWYIADLKEFLQGKRFYAMGDDTARGASPYPTEAEIRLITAFLMDAFTGGGQELAVSRLLTKLHPNPDEETLKEIMKLTLGERRGGGGYRDEALLPIAKKLAVLVRGGELPKGAKPKPLDLYKHGVALVLEDAKEQGGPKKEAKRVMSEEYGVNEDDFERLWKFSPPKP